MSVHIQPAGFVLAGGKSRRMGQDKARLTLDGCSLIEIAVAILRTVTPEVSIIGDRPDLETFAPVMPDRYRDCGPLGGIEAALNATSREWNFILGVDLPFIPPVLFTHLLQSAEGSTADAAVPRVRDRLQPLCAVYRQSLLPRVRQMLEARRLKVEGAFIPETLCVVEEDELREIGITAESFANLNLPADLEVAQSRLARHRDPGTIP